MENSKGLRLPRLISDGMILQRDEVIKIWGFIPEGKKVIVNFANYTYEAVGDYNGKWEVLLKPLPAGGPYEMEIIGDQSISIRDILMGDLWLCGGQSNMELPIARVMERYREEVNDYENPQIRMFRVPMVYDFNAPQEELREGTWQPLTSEHRLDFTATGYFFAKKLFETYHVPIGLIHTAIGGTPVEAWISKEGLETFPVLLEEATKYRDENHIKEVLDEDEKRMSTWQKHLDQMDEGITNKEKKWFDPLYVPKDWSVFNIPAFWNEKEINRSAGAVWFRKEIDVPATMLNKQVRLLLGTIIDSDTVYLNGQKIGETGYQYPPRIYPIPEGVLKEGKNVLVVRVICWQNKGGFTPDKIYGIQTLDDFIDLRGTWQYKVAAQVEELSPQIFVQYKPLGVFNGMIAPLKNIKLKGVIWYQGESNTHWPQTYSELFKALIGDWRKLWQDESLPFIYAQLPNFNPADESPSESNWAEIREAQREALEIANTGMAVTIDLGEWNDLHPLNKKDVGERLALSARAIAYDEELVYSGPLFKEARLEKNTIVITFSHLGSGLLIKGDQPKGFAISEDGQHFIHARAALKGQEVVVWHEQMPKPVEVRYAWADNPNQANLYNKENLPASPFRVNVASYMNG